MKSAECVRTAVLTAALFVCVWMPAAYASTRAHKLCRGAVNVLTGWIELPQALSRGAGEENIVVGLGGGFMQGIAKGMLRTGVGIYDVVTFPIPIPADFAPVYEPEYVFE